MIWPLIIAAVIGIGYCVLRYFDEICDFFSNLADWVFGGATILLLIVLAIVGVRLVLTAIGLSEVLSIVMALIIVAGIGWLLWKKLDKAEEKEQYLRPISRYQPMSELELARAKERESFTNYRSAEERVSSILNAINCLKQQRTSMIDDQYKAEHEKLERELSSAQESLQLCKTQWEEDSSNPLL